MTVASNVICLERRGVPDRGFEELSTDCMNLVESVLAAAGIEGRSCLRWKLLKRAWERIFFSGAKRRFFFLNAADKLTESNEGDMAWQITQCFGDFTENLDDTAEAKEAAKVIQKYVIKVLPRHIKLNRQCNSVEQRVDMFAEEAQITIENSKASVVFVHEPFDDKECEPEIERDFLAHFPEFLDLVKLIAAARFASDRRTAFIWLHAPSSWGKGLLVAALFYLGIVFEMSVKEIEKAIEGGAVGASPTDFVRAWVLNFDEFKTVKSEIKQLNNKVSLSPKYQLKCYVPLYTKLLTSAEDVAALTGSEGVEDQFAKRFMYMNPTGCIDDRAVFNKYGKDRYRNVISHVIARELNRYVDEMRAMGREAATKYADEELAALHKSKGLGRHFNSLSESTVEHIADLKFLLIGYGEKGCLSPEYSALPEHLQKKLRGSCQVGMIASNRVVLLKRPADFVNTWLHERVERGQFAKVLHKVKEIQEGVNDISEIDKPKRFTPEPLPLPSEIGVRKGHKGNKGVPTKGIAVILHPLLTFI